MHKKHIDTINHHYAGVLLITEEGKLIGQLRDNKPGIDNPGKISTFGGAVEAGESPRYAAWRELVQEETNLKFGIDSLVLFLEDTSWREMTGEWEARHFYYVKINEEQLKDLEVYEGQGWAEIAGPDDPRLAKVFRPAIQRFLGVKTQ